MSELDRDELSQLADIVFLADLFGLDQSGFCVSY